MTPSQPDRGDEIQQRYWSDAEFHARVDLVVQAVERDRGVTFQPHDRSLATLTAAYALHPEDR